MNRANFGAVLYELEVLDHHIHNRERWFGKLAVQTATDWADNNISTPFRAISGNNAYGSDPNDEAQVIGTADTPVFAGYKYYDIHRLLIVGCSVTTPFKIRVIYSNGVVTMADAIAAEQYSTIMVRIDPAVGASIGTPVDILTPRQQCGVSKTWLQFWSVTDNATLDFYVGWHEYPE